MLDIQLRYKGQGVFQTAASLDFRLANDELEAGEMVRARVSRLRSVRQNNLFHALIQAAFDNQRGGPDLPSWEHLKAWLLIQAEHVNEKRVFVGNLSLKEAKAAGTAIAAALRGGSDYVAIAYDPNTHEFVERSAKSVSFRKVTSDEMAAIMDKVVEIVCTEIVPGMDPESILNMARSKAA